MIRKHGLDMLLGMGARGLGLWGPWRPMTDAFVAYTGETPGVSTKAMRLHCIGRWFWYSAPLLCVIGLDKISQTPLNAMHTYSI